MGGANPVKQPGQQSNDDLPLPPRLEEKLEVFKERLWSVKMAEGALAGLVGLCFSYLVVFFLDRFVDTPTWLRTVLLVSGFGVPALGLPLLWHRWVWRQRSLTQAARLLKRRYPGLGDELLGVIELAHNHPGGNSLVLIEAAMRQVDERAGNEDFSHAIPARGYGRWLLSAVGALVVSSLLLTLVPDAARNALVRWISPWKMVERYTFAQLKPVADTLVVPYAEAFELSPTLTDGTEWKPDSATVKLPGKTRLSSPRSAENYEFTIPPQREGGTLSLRVGDAREKITVEPLPRPELTAVEAVIRLPDYLRYTKDPVLPVRSGVISIVEGSTATIRATASRDLAEASTDGEAAQIDGAVFSTAPIQVETPISRTFTWSDIHGLQAKSPLKLTINPAEDAAPDIFANQVGTRHVVLEDEVITFDISAADDFGLREIGLEWRAIGGAESPETAEAGEKPVAAGEPEKTSVQTLGTFSAKREGVAPQTLEIRAFATDFLPNRERSYTPAFVVHVLSPQDHAKWLTEEFSKWFRNAREVYEREQQLHEANLALRKLGAAELDEPENRRRLQEQASAESGNARRLDALNRSGRSLVEEATRNTEFDAKRLESWADMMLALDLIAKERMPSVADLIQQASRAPGAGAGAAGTAEISDKEESLTSEKTDNTPEAKKEETGASHSTAPLRLPQTTLEATEVKKEDDDSSAATPARNKLDKAIEEQKELLAEFARVTDELQEILSSLEASTFVKRLKAASRKQTEIASTLNQTLNESFGLPRHRVEQQFRDVAEGAAGEQETQSRFVYDIQTDLEAYFQRKQEAIYKNVLDQMKNQSVVSGIKAIGQESLVNLNGRSIASSEFWADTLDRWAEELVAGSGESEPNEEQGESKSLPPEIVLNIMKALHEEMQLRDETREMEGTRPVFAPDVYASKVRPLEYTQTGIRERVDTVVADIEALPDADSFGKEIQLLSLVSDVMRQAHAVLARPDTGSEAIAAQTEAIELLLQSKRQQSGGGGGGGGNPGNGGSSGGGGSSLSDIGPGSTSDESISLPSREVDQSTGKAGRELPEEFRRGLDTYFNELESN